MSVLVRGRAELVTDEADLAPACVVATLEVRAHRTGRGLGSSHRSF